MSIEQAMETYREVWNARHAVGQVFTFDGSQVTTVTPGYLRRRILVVDIENPVEVEVDGQKVTRQLKRTVAVECLKS